MRQPLRIGLLACGLILSACSPYVYQDEVRGFATGVDNLNAAYMESLAAANVATRSKLHAGWTARRAKLAPSPGCDDLSEAAPCRVQEGATAVSPSPIMAEAPKGAVLLRAIKDYASALASIVNAEDRAALDRATGELKNTLIGLAEQVDARQPGRAPIAARTGAIAGLFGQIAATGLDQRRFEALRAGVTTADQDLAILADAVAKGLGALAQERFTLTHKEASDMQTGFAASPTVSEGDYLARVAAFEEKVAELQGLKDGNPRAATDQMVKAHAALRTALEDPSTQFTEVTRAVRAFIAQAQAVRDAFAPAKGSGK
jgi:hypothetical protein